MSLADVLHEVFSDAHDFLLSAEGKVMSALSKQDSPPTTEEETPVVAGHQGEVEFTDPPTESSPTTESASLPSESETASTPPQAEVTSDAPVSGGHQGEVDFSPPPVEETPAEPTPPASVEGATASTHVGEVDFSAENPTVGSEENLGEPSAPSGTGTPA